MLKQGLLKILLPLLILCPQTTLLAQNAKSLLWKIEGKQLQKPSYLYGTMHVTNEEVFNVNDSLLHFLQQCDGFANEIDPKETMQVMIKRYIFNSDVPTVYDVINYDDTVTTLTSSTTNSVDWKNNKVKHTFLDGYLLKMAMHYQKKIGGLEVAENQVGKRRQEELMVIPGKDIGYNVSPYASFFTTYTEENIDKLYTAASTSEKDMLDLAKRNIDMFNSIKPLIQHESWVFAVGALHLAGTKGLIKLLKDEGYTVTPVLKKKSVDLSKVALPNYKANWQLQQATYNAYTIQMPFNTIKLDSIQNRINRFYYFDLADQIIYKSEHIANLGILFNNNTFHKLFIANNYINITQTATITFNKTNQFYEIICSNDNVKKIYRIYKLDNDLVINSIETGYYTKDKQLNIDYFFNSYIPNKQYASIIHKTMFSIIQDNTLYINIPVANHMEHTIYKDITSDNNEFSCNISFYNNTQQHSSIHATSYTGSLGSCIYKENRSLLSMKENILSAKNSTTLLDSYFTKNNIPLNNIKYRFTENDITIFTTAYLFSFDTRLYVVKYASLHELDLPLFDSLFVTHLKYNKPKPIACKPYPIKNIIEIQLPDKPQQVFYQNNTGNDFVRSSIDTSTGSNMIVSCITYNTYLQCKTQHEISEFWINNNTDDGDSIYNKVDTIINNINTCTYEMVNINNSNRLILKTKHILYGKQTIKLMTSGDSAYINSKPVHQFFSNYRILTPTIDSNYIFINKNELILTILSNPKADSVDYTLAYNAMDETYFEEKDGERIFKLFIKEKTAPRFDDIDISDKLFNTLKNINSKNIANIVYKYWPNNGDFTLKNYCVELLLLNKTEDNYKRIVAFLAEKKWHHLSIKNNSIIIDSLPLATWYYNALRNITKEANANVYAANLAMHLLQHKVINIKDVYIDTALLLTHLKQLTKKNINFSEWPLISFENCLSLIDTLQLKSYTPWLLQFGNTKSFDYYKEKVLLTLVHLQANPIQLQQFANQASKEKTMLYRVYNVLCNTKKISLWSQVTYPIQRIQESYLTMQLEYDYDDGENIILEKKGALAIKDTTNNTIVFDAYIFNTDIEPENKQVVFIAQHNYGIPIIDKHYYIINAIDYNLPIDNFKNALTERIKQ